MNEGTNTNVKCHAAVSNGIRPSGRKKSSDSEVLHADVDREELHDREKELEGEWPIAFPPEPLRLNIGDVQDEAEDEDRGDEDEGIGEGAEVDKPAASASWSGTSHRGT